MTKPEIMRLLVRALAKSLDEFEYKHGVLLKKPDIRAAIKALEVIEHQDNRRVRGMEEACSVYMHKLAHADDYNDIDLSRPDYSGMDDPL